MIEDSDVFTCKPARKHNEYRHQEYEVVYPNKYKKPNSLRPEILLQITEFPLLEPKLQSSITSMYAQVADLTAEIKAIDCVTLPSIAAEKIVALLRRTALEEICPSEKPDERLIRHVYDLHLMNQRLPDTQVMQALIDQVITMDIDQFGDKHPQLKDDPRAELLRGLHILMNDPIHKERYEQFLGPLVYHPNPATWDVVIKNLQVMAERYLSK